MVLQLGQHQHDLDPGPPFEDVDDPVELDLVDLRVVENQHRAMLGHPVEDRRHQERVGTGYEGLDAEEHLEYACVVLAHELDQLVRRVGLARVVGADHQHRVEPVVLGYLVEQDGVALPEIVLLRLEVVRGRLGDSELVHLAQQGDGAGIVAGRRVVVGPYAAIGVEEVEWMWWQDVLRVRNCRSAATPQAR